MANETTRKVDRRSFLRGSALFAGALGLSVASTRADGLRLGASAAQAPQHQKPKPEEKPKEDEKKKPEDPFADGDKPKDGKLIDKEGREYRVCPQCAYNMYKQGRMWVCENCGYSYVE